MISLNFWMIKLRHRVCMEIAQDCTAGKWSRSSVVLNHDFDQLSSSRVVHLMCRSMTQK